MKRIGLASLLLLACTKSDSKGKPDVTAIRDAEGNVSVVGGYQGEAPKQKTTREGAIAYASMRSREEPIPARYSAALPDDIATAKGEWSDHPPYEIVDVAVCRGDAIVREQLVSAVAAAASKGASLADLHEGYDKARGQYCSSASYCAWVVELTRSQRGAAQEFWWSALEDCLDLATRQRLTAPDVPSAVFVRAYQPVPGEAIDPRWVPAVRAAVTAAIGTDDERTLRPVVHTLAETDDATAIATAKELYALPKLDPFLAEGIIQGMQANPSKVARDFAAQHCGELERVECGARPEPLAPRDPFVDLQAWVEGGADVGELVLRHPERRGDIVAALQKCAGESDTCLVELATLDRAWAVTIAKERTQKSVVVDALLAFPRLADLDAKLDALGFTRLRPAEPGEDPWEIESALSARGRLTSFDTETGIIPNHHEIILAELAGLIAPDLDGVVFAEVPPAFDDDFEKIDPTAGYVLVAWMDGKRYEVDAQDLGDWYDLDAVLGMINALARERSAAGRVVALPTGDQTSTVLGGPGPGIARAIEEGLVKAESNLAAGVESGQQAEEQVIEAIRRGEL